MESERAVRRGFSGSGEFPSEAALRAFGRAFGGALRGGEIVGLVGPLGSGKTVFTQALAAGLGVPASVPVTSPTFVLHRRYLGRVTLEHLDAYRLRSSRDLDALGAGDLLEGAPFGPSVQGVPPVVVIEWADKVKELLPERSIWIEFTIAGPECRSLAVTLPPCPLLPEEEFRELRSLLERTPGGS